MLTSGTAGQTYVTNESVLLIRTNGEALNTGTGFGGGAGSSFAPGSGVILYAAFTKVPVSVCGTMASEPLHAHLLVGLGVRGLSMEASAIPVVREAISRASMAELARVAELCLEAETEARVREAVSSSLGPRLLDLDAVRDGA